jgi:hypothetical protein
MVARVTAMHSSKSEVQRILSDIGMLRQGCSVECLIREYVAMLSKSLRVAALMLATLAIVAGQGRSFPSDTLR